MALCAIAFEQAPRRASFRYLKLIALIFFERLSFHVRAVVCMGAVSVANCFTPSQVFSRFLRGILPPFSQLNHLFLPAGPRVGQSTSRVRFGNLSPPNPL